MQYINMRNSSLKETTEAYPEKKMEANPEKIKSVVEHQKVSKEKAAVYMIRALKERYGYWHLAV